MELLLKIIIDFSLDYMKFNIYCRAVKKDYSLFLGLVTPGMAVGLG